MRELRSQIRDYFDELGEPVTIDDIFFSGAGFDRVRPLDRLHRPAGLRRPWLIVAGAAIGVVVLVAVIPLLLRGPTPPTSVPPATEPPTTTTTVVTTTTTVTTTTAPPPQPAPEELARQFIEAIGTDSATALALVAPDAEVDAPGLDDVADIAGWLAWSEAIGWNQTFEGCEGTGAEIQCGYTYTNSWMETVGASPGTGSTFTLTINDGIITAFTDEQVGSPIVVAWNAYRGWLERTYPEAVDQMMTATDRPILTPESIALWERYTEEFASTRLSE